MSQSTRLRVLAGGLGLLVGLFAQRESLSIERGTDVPPVTLKPRLWITVRAFGITIWKREQSPNTEDRARLVAGIALACYLLTGAGLGVLLTVVVQNCRANQNKSP